MKLADRSSLASLAVSYAKQIITHRLILYLTLFMVIGSTLVGIMNSMDGTQYALTKSLAEGHTIYIDDYRVYAMSTDFAIGRDDHVLTDREPGPSIVAVPFYYIGKALNPVLQLPYGGDNEHLLDESKLQIITYLSQVFVVSIGLVWAFDLLRRLGASSAASFLTCLLIGLGTLILRYSASFWREPAVGIFLLLAVLQALSFRKYKRKRDLALVGVLSGLAVLHDYMAAIPVVLLMASLLLLERPRIGDLACLAAGLAPFVLVILAYNYAAFGQLVTSPHQHEGLLTYMTNLGNDFRTPLKWGLYLNLFSFGPIPRSAVGWLLAHKDLADKTDLRWAMENIYKGVLVQSPFLAFGLLGWILGRKRLGAGLVYPAVIVVSWLILMSVITAFWGPNTFDSRYLIPLVPTMGAGLVFLIDNVIRQRRSWISPAATWTLATAALVSVFFAWESSVTNFGPNLAGNWRWDPAKLFNPKVSAHSLKDAFMQTFPNIHNFHILLGLALVLYAAVHFLPAIGRAGQRRLPFNFRLPGWLQRFSETRPTILQASGLVLIIGVLAFGALKAGGSSSNQGGTPTPTPTPPTAQAVQATALPGAEERNAQRIQDLTVLSQLLQQFYARGNSYPSTGGGLQALCPIDGVDAGCKLKDLGATLPADPLGSPLANGYWYISDGGTFTLIAAWEGTTKPPADFPCPATLTSIGEHSSLVCLQGKP